jgi:hypothetical protein
MPTDQPEADSSATKQREQPKVRRDAEILVVGNAPHKRLWISAGYVKLEHSLGFGADVVTIGRQTLERNRHEARRLEAEAKLVENARSMLSVGVEKLSPQLFAALNDFLDRVQKETYSE